ncbi:hypothetical protein Spp001_51 [Shewanella phage Spp001]|uniref:Uncharacterized protein n=1 Tax=Shewanella phage Spp001 TaxID=1445859 RepID=W6EKA2_9CAUD|nr:hypothetical protein Spp001_51 [Shewanella phage Spp001]AHJ10559.1 hypothetical protein Spp001_51 [Shewanella phage Spp001]
MTFEDAEVIGNKFREFETAMKPDLIAVGTTLKVLDAEVTVVATDMSTVGKTPCKPCAFRDGGDYCASAPRCTKVGEPSQYVHFVATKDFHNPYRFLEGDAE